MHLKGADIREAIPSFSFETSVLKLLIGALEKNGNKVAQIYHDTGKSYTFTDILEQSKWIASGLTRAGLASGDYVVICCTMSSIAYSAQLGVMFMGAIPVLIDTKYASEIHKFTEGHAVKAVFCDKILLQSVNESLSKMNPEPTLIATTDCNDPTLKLLLLPSDEFSLFEVNDIKKKVVLILLTSASTSDPKPVQICDLALQRLGYSFVDESTDMFLLRGSFAWNSSTISLVSSILKGYTLVFSATTDYEMIFKIIERYRVTGCTVFASVVNRFAKEASLSAADLSSLTLVIFGGGVIKRRVIESFVSEVLKGKTGIHNIYGSTEVGLITSWRNIDLLDFSKANSCGCLAPGVEVKITDESGCLVEQGNTGEVRVRSLSMMTGYWNLPALNAQLFDSDEFFKTGDSGYFDCDGFLYIVGRSSEVINQGGFKVSLPELEDLLKSHSGVLDAAIVAQPHISEDLTVTYTLIAFIVVKPGCQLREEDILSYVTDPAGATITLHKIAVVDDIPRTHRGKVYKGKLHVMAEKLFH